MSAARVPEAPRLPIQRRALDWVLLLSGALALLVGCTADASTPVASQLSTPIPVETPSPSTLPATPSPIPSATQPATPLESFPNLPTLPPSEDRVVVYGNLDCGIENISQRKEGETTVYDGMLVCWHQMSDPRVSGREESEMTVVYLDVPGLTIDKWSYPTGTLTNEGGTWRASGWGSEFWDDKGENLRTSGTSYYVGEGGYAGLTYRLLYAQGPETSPFVYLAAGWFEPAE